MDAVDQRMSARFTILLMLLLPALAIGQALRNVGVLPDVAALTNRNESAVAPLVQVLGKTNAMDWGGPKTFLYVEGATNTVDYTNVFPTALGRGRWFLQKPDAVTDIVTDTNDLIAFPSGQAASYHTLLRSWVLSEAFAVSSLTYTPGTVAITNATVIWPDNETGILRVTSWNDTWEAVDEFTISHSVYSITQPLMLRDSLGMVTNRPNVIIAP